MEKSVLTSKENYDITRWVWLPFVLSFLCITLFQGTRGLYETTEGRYALCARETMATGNFLEPMLNGKHHWTKPPLTYICIATGLYLFGEQSTWGARFYLIPAFFFTVVFVYLLAQQLWDKQSGILSALIYAVSPFIVGAGNIVSTDTLLVLWHSLTFYAFWQAYQTKQRTFIYLFWLGLGLGCITKGPMGLVPLMGILPFCLWRWLIHKERLWFFISPIGITVFFIVGIAWYFWENWKYPGLLRYWFMEETVQRLAEGEFDRNPEWYKIFPVYILPLLFGTGLFIILIPYLVYKSKMRQNKIIGDQLSDKQWFFLFCSFLFPFIFFSVSKSRLALYILPLFIPMSIAMGRLFYWAIQEKFISWRTISYIAILNAGLIIALKGISTYYPTMHNMKILSSDIQPLLQRYPDAEFYCAKTKVLNGLKFYTNINLSETDLFEIENYPNLEELKTAVIQFLCETYTKKRVILIPRKREQPIRQLQFPPNIQFYIINKFWFALTCNET